MLIFSFNLPHFLRYTIPALGLTIAAVFLTVSAASAAPESESGPSQSSVPAGAVLDSSRLTITEENDKFASGDDGHYTQGARLSYLSDPVTVDGVWNRPFSAIAGVLPVFGGAGAQRRYTVEFGQSIFTPHNTQEETPSGNDRPYAAWFYTGVGMLQETRHETHDTLENAELQVGVVGRWALGGITQNDFHQFIGVNPSKGWKNQLSNEPGFMLSYERKWRFQQPLGGNFSIDVIPEVGGTAGTIMTYASAGGKMRLGQNLAANYGTNQIRPSLSGTDWFDPGRLDGKFGWSLFGGVQGRAVVRNIFLDGNTFQSSPYVRKKPLVADFVGGVDLFWADAVRMSFTVTQRTQEFYGQRTQPDRFGGVSLSIKFW